MADETKIIRIACGTNAQWADEVRSRKSGELGYNITTKEIKIGDGETPFMELKALLTGDNAIAQLEAIINAANGIAGLGSDAKVPEANLPVKFFIGELYFQLVIRSGFVWANGQVLSGVTANYPLLKAWLKDTGASGGAFLRKTLAEWNAEWNDAKWNAPDTGDAATRVGMSPYYVLDESADTIKVPDLRGAYQAAAGFGGQANGKTLADAIREIYGSALLSISGGYAHVSGLTGAFYTDTATTTIGSSYGSGSANKYKLFFSAGNQVPTDTAVHPRSVTEYLCIYAGAPA
jgi:hypothetical protein